MEDRNILRLVRKAKRGDRDAFCKLIELKSKDILYLATSLMGNKADGEDSAQEAVMLIARNIEKLRKPETFNTWIYRIVFTVCMKEKNRKSAMARRSIELEGVQEQVCEADASVLPETSYDIAAQNEVLLSAINSLPESYRACVILFYYEGFSYEEIAESLGVTHDSVANLLRRAKQRLQEILERDAFGAVLVKDGALTSATVIGSALNEDTDTVVTTSMTDRLIQIAREVPLAESAKWGMSAAITSLMASTKTAGICAAGAVLLVLGGSLFAFGNWFEGGQPAVDAADVPEHAAESTEAAVPDTLLDEGAAETLENFASSNLDPVVWNEFATENALAIGASVVTAEYAYTVYFKEDGESNLTVVERRDNAGGVSLAYGMCPPGTKPQGPAIIEAFEKWGGG